MLHPSSRDDISKFVVHLTRDYQSNSAQANLFSILNDKVIYARNAHCLFKHELNRLGFNKNLLNCFNTVCFTETPLTQIKRLVAPVAGRKIELQPYGLVFHKFTLLERGASPAIYINTNGTQLRGYLLKQFREHFAGTKSIIKFKREQRDYHESIIQYYSLVNIISSNHDFTWEREWRFQGDFKFKYFDLVAIITESPEKFEQLCRNRLNALKRRYITRIPIISPDWSYEDIVEVISAQIWNNANAERIPQA